MVHHVMISLSSSSKNVHTFQSWCKAYNKTCEISSGVQVKDWKEYKDIIAPYSFFILHNRRLDCHHFDTTGPIGCFLAHKKVWKICVQRNEPTWIFEEGVSSYRQNIFHELDTYHENVDLILGHTVPVFSIYRQNSICKKGDDVGSYLQPIDKIYFGTKCYRISPRFASFLLEHSKQIDLHVDSYINVMAIYYADQFQSYRTPFNIVTAWSSGKINHSVDCNLLIPCILMLIILCCILVKFLLYRKYKTCTKNLKHIVCEN